MLSKIDTVQTIKNSCQSIIKQFTADIQNTDVLIDECFYFKELQENLFTLIEISMAFTNYLT